MFIHVSSSALFSDVKPALTWPVDVSSSALFAFLQCPVDGSKCSVLHRGLFDNKVFVGGGNNLNKVTVPVSISVLNDNLRNKFVLY